MLREWNVCSQAGKKKGCKQAKGGNDPCRCPRVSFLPPFPLFLLLPLPFPGRERQAFLLCCVPLASSSFFALNLASFVQSPSFLPIFFPLPVPVPLLPKRKPGGNGPRRFLWTRKMARKQATDLTPWFKDCINPRSGRPSTLCIAYRHHASTPPPFPCPPTCPPSPRAPPELSPPHGPAFASSKPSATPTPLFAISSISFPSQCFPRIPSLPA